ncbi:MAG: hypothetical protein OXC56_02535 [Chloroflexi bacterium]|nr:hypothetical protein [Chloroflexota bacterium]
MATLAVACASDDTPPRAGGFYAEIRAEVDPSADDPLAGLGLPEEQSTIRWWYAPDPARWRWEFETVGGIIDDGLLLTVGDGVDLWTYDDRSNTYQRQTIEGRASGIASPLSFSAPLGPANVESVDAFVELWRERGDDFEVELAGEAEVLGRRTGIVEIRLAAGGLTRVYIDPERMFIMRWAADGAGGGQSYRAEVTALDYGADIDDTRFSFVPPPDARETESLGGQSCGRSIGPIGIAGAVFPREPGFLNPSYAPSGYRSASAGGESSAGRNCVPSAVWVLLEGSEGGYILLRQRFRPGGIPQSARAWHAVDSALDEAYRRSANGVVSLLWREGDIVALLDTNSVSFEELLRIAESAELVPSSGRPAGGG